MDIKEFLKHISLRASTIVVAFVVLGGGIMLGNYVMSTPTSAPPGYSPYTLASVDSTRLLADNSQCNSAQAGTPCQTTAGGPYDGLCNLNQECVPASGSANCSDPANDGKACGGNAGICKNNNCNYTQSTEGGGGAGSNPTNPSNPSNPSVPITGTGNGTTNSANDNLVRSVAQQINNAGGLVPCNGVGSSSLTQAQITALQADIAKETATMNATQATFNTNNFGQFKISYAYYTSNAGLVVQNLTIPATDFTLDTPIDMTKEHNNTDGVSISGGTYTGKGITLSSGTLTSGTHIDATYNRNGSTYPSVSLYSPAQSQTQLQGALKDYQSRIDADNAKLNVVGGACDLNSLIQLIRNVMNAMFAISIFLATIAFVYIGWVLLTSQGNVSKIETAKKMAVSVLIGFLFVLAAWLIVYTITHVLIKNPSFNSFMT